jgi:flagellar assembly protein FliH
MDQSFSARPTRPFHFDKIFSAAPSPTSSTYAADSLLDAAALRIELEALREGYDQALLEAHARGVAEGQQRARAERDQALLAATDALHAALEEFTQDHEAMIDALRNDAAGLALAIGESLAGHALRDAPVEAIDQAIGRVLGRIARGQEVIISVHPSLLNDVEARIAARQSLDRRQLNLIVTGDDDLTPGDAHLRWDSGGQHLSAQERMTEIQAELSAITGVTPITDI